MLRKNFRMTAGEGVSCGGEVHRELDERVEMQPVCQRFRPMRDEGGSDVGMVTARRFPELPCLKGECLPGAVTSQTRQMAAMVLQN